jgi:hypothetical protein
MNIDVKFPGLGTRQSCAPPQSIVEKRLADLWRSHEDLKSWEIWKKTIMMELSETRADEYCM